MLVGVKATYVACLGVVLSTLSSEFCEVAYEMEAYATCECVPMKIIRCVGVYEVI